VAREDAPHLLLEERARRDGDAGEHHLLAGVDQRADAARGGARFEVLTDGE
jgi:hypothetical protein